jgi:hypothetical protein
MESRFKLVPSNRDIRRQRGAVVTPPDTSRAMQLVRSIFSLQLLSQTKQTKLLLNDIQPFISFQRFLRLFKERGLGIQKLLEITMLVWCRSLTTLASIPVD